MKQITSFMKFVFLGDDKYFLQYKRKKEKIARTNGKREIIWMKNEYGNSTFWHKNVFHKN